MVFLIGEMAVCKRCFLVLVIEITRLSPKIVGRAAIYAQDSVFVDPERKEIG